MPAICISTFKLPNELSESLASGDALTSPEVRGFPFYRVHDASGCARSPFDTVYDAVYETENGGRRFR